MKFDKTLIGEPAPLKHWALFAKSGDSIYHNTAESIGYHARHPDLDAFVSVLDVVFSEPDDFTLSMMLLTV